MVWGTNPSVVTFFLSCTLASRSTQSTVQLAPGLPWGKNNMSMVLTTHPLLVPGSEWVGTIPPPTPSVLAMAHHGVTLYLYFIKSHQVTHCCSANISSSWLVPADLTSKHQQGGFWSTGMWHCVTGLVVPTTVKEQAAFIFKGQEVQAIILGLLKIEVKNTILWNPGNYFPNNTASHFQRPDFPETLLWHLKSHRQNYVLH